MKPVKPLSILSGKLAIIILAALVSLHYSIYKDGVKLAIFKISYLNMVKNSADKYILFVGYIVRAHYICSIFVITG